jgi:hypothetical protein
MKHVNTHRRADTVSMVALQESLLYRVVRPTQIDPPVGGTSTTITMHRRCDTTQRRRVLHTFGITRNETIVAGLAPGIVTRALNQVGTALMDRALIQLAGVSD